MRYLIFTAIAHKDNVARAILPDYIEWIDGGSEEFFETYLEHKWTAIVPEDVYGRLARDWSLDPEKSEPNMGILCEYGWLESDSYDFDGMDWNVGGWTPVENASLRVSEPFTP